MTIQITIGGQLYDVPTPFAAGHTINEAEASALNNHMHDIARATLLRKAKAPEGLTQDEVDDYFDDFAFGLRRSRTRIDPVQEEAWSLASDMVLRHLKAKGLKRFTVNKKTGEGNGGYSPEQFDAWVEQTLASKPHLYDVAREKLAAEQKELTSLDTIVG